MYVVKDTVGTSPGICTRSTTLLFTGHSFSVYLLLFRVFFTNVLSTFVEDLQCHCELGSVLDDRKTKI